MNWNNYSLRYRPLAFGQQGSIHEGFQVQGPSVLLAFGKERKNNWAIGISTHVNHLSSSFVTNTGPYAFAILNSVADSLAKGPVTIRNTGMSALTWQDIGATYSRVVLETQKSALTVGATVKMVKAVHAFHFYSDEINVNPLEGDSVEVSVKDAEYFRSIGQDLSENGFEDYSDTHPWGVAADFGLIYSFYKDRTRNRYPMNNTFFTDHQDAGHLFQAGIAVTNLGKVKVNGDPRAHAFVPFGQRMPSGLGNDVTGFSFLNYTVDDFDDALDSLGGGAMAAEQRVNLPTMFNAFLDGRLPGGAGLNVAYYLPLGVSDATRMGPVATSALVITPKYEMSVFGVYAPLRIDEVSGMSVGASLRIAGFFIGTPDVISLFTRADSDRKMAGVQVGLKIPVRYLRHKDTDNDKVSDEVDVCRSERGPWVAMGCPDADIDGVSNLEDECPEEAGPKEFKGCPDNDGDGIINKLDFCPDNYGPAEGTPKPGCPDADGDGFIEAFDEDKCPDVFGARNGCPDRDGDGVFDHEDGCPDTYGSIARGCPDTDEDGLLDDEDGCPQMKGQPWNGGCPGNDEDGDGIYEPYDMCPDVAGVEPDGCPEPTRISMRIIYNVIYFEQASDLSKPEEDKVQAIAPILKEVLSRRTDYNIYIIGHTDVTEPDNAKERTSLARASEVRYALMRAGIPEERILIEAAGDLRPHKVRSFPSGKYLDRRAEIYLDAPPLIQNGQP